MIGNIMFLTPDSPVPMIAVQTALNLHRHPRIPTFVKDFCQVLSASLLGCACSYIQSFRPARFLLKVSFSQHVSFQEDRPGYLDGVECHSHGYIQEVRLKSHE